MGKKNRAHATHMLAKKSAALYSAIEKDQRSQMKINGQLAAQTRAAKLDIANALREAKDDFSKRIGALSKTVAKNDKKFEGKMDKLTGIVRANAQKTADNYLSLKAYAVTAKDKITDYVAKGKGKNLSSLGTVLTEVAGMAKVHPGKAEGLSATKTLPAIFGGEKIAVDNSVSKINGLVNEYITMANMVRKQYSMGLGKYLLEKLEASMQGKGALQVDKVSDKSGNFVFINGHAVGLSNKLNDFEGLAVRMGHYEATLAKLTAALSGKVHKAIKKKMVYAKPPEWSGD